MIGGLMLRGAGDSHVVVRAIGPSLSKSGIVHPLPDPTLDVRNANGDSIGVNNDWTDDPANAAEVTASGLAPKNHKEAALSLHLPAGDYTVVVSGKGTTGGIGLVEVYNLR